MLFDRTALYRTSLYKTMLYDRTVLYKLTYL